MTLHFQCLPAVSFWALLLSSLFNFIWSMTNDVLQGAVLGSVLFLMYTADLVGLVRTIGLFAHAYADDLQVCCHLSPGEEHLALQRFRSCSDSVSRWMSSIRLKLNPLETERFGCIVAEKTLVSFKMTLNCLIISLLQLELFVTWVWY